MDRGVKTFQDKKRRQEAGRDRQTSKLTMGKRQYVGTRTQVGAHSQGGRRPFCTELERESACKMYGNGVVVVVVVLMRDSGRETSICT